jgi:DNA-3-methyladenine glycosylase II
VWPFRLRVPMRDGLYRRRGAALQRLVRVGDAAVFTGVVDDGDRVVLAARAATEEAAAEGLRKMRIVTGVDEDHREFYERFADDRYIGRAVRAHPQLRLRRRPDAWEALSFAILEQLIETVRAEAIQRRLIARHGSRDPDTGLREAPTAAAIAALSPAQLCAFDLPLHRAQTLRRAAIEVASGRADPGSPDSEQRLLAIPGLGPWTFEMLAVQGQARYDRVPAGDLGFLKILGRMLTGNPRARADVDAVREFFSRYGEWEALAGEYLMRAPTAQRYSPRVPVLAGTR